MIVDSITFAAMAKPATGSVRQVNGVWVARVRLRGEDKPSFALPWAASENAAKERANMLARVARQLGKYPDRKIVCDLLDELADASTDRAVRVAMLQIEAVIGQQVQPIGESEVPTFKELAERWTSGELAKDGEYRDHVTEKRSVKDDIIRFEKHIYPVIGDIPIDRVTLDHYQEVMRKLPADLRPATRRNVAGLMTRLLNIAAFPMRLIERSPIPPGVLPKPGPRKAMAYLYPDELRRLLGCTRIVFEQRLLWAVLATEGMREGEALVSDWTDYDLKRGAIKLDENKTDDPRSWTLNPGTVRALQWYRDNKRADAERTDHVFIGPKGGKPDKHSLAALLRSHLELIGLREERPELFEESEARQPIRVHDLRATFVTVNLANGKTETWVTDRTGHKSSGMVAKYRRLARHFQELHIGDFTPLEEALPELRQPSAAPTDPSSPAAGDESIGHRLDIAGEASANYQESKAESLRPQRELNPCYQRERLVS